MSLPASSSAPAPAPTPAPAPAPPSPLLLFLDIDGVLNKQGRQRKKKAPADALLTSALRCVPSVPSIEALVAELQLSDSFDPRLLHHFCHLVHTAAGCIAAAAAAAASASVPPPSRQPSPRLAAASPQPPAMPAIVLSSTWRLERAALASVQQLMERLHIVQTRTSERDAAAALITAAEAAAATARVDLDASSSSNVSSAASGSSSASSSCCCQLRDLRPMECTPDLEGWGTRLEEICCYLRDYVKGSSSSGSSNSSGSGSSSNSVGSSVASAVASSTACAPSHPRPCPRFLIVDDMELYGCLSLHRGPRVGRIALFDGCRARTLKTDGTRGLDARALGVGLGLVATEAPPPLTFADELAAFMVTKPGEDEEAEEQPAPLSLQLGPMPAPAATVSVAPSAPAAAVATAAAVAASVCSAWPPPASARLDAPSRALA